MGLARRASSSRDCGRDARRACLEGPGVSSSSSSWGIETNKGKQLHQGERGHPWAWIHPPAMLP